MQDPLPYLYGAIFLGVLFLVEGIYYLLADMHRDADGRLVNRRLRLLSGGRPGDEVAGRLRRDGGDGRLHRRLLALSPYARLDSSLRMAGLSLSAPRLLALMAGGSLALFALARLFLGFSTPRAAAAAASLGIILPVLAVRRMAGRRERLFQLQLVDAIDIMVRSLRAGHPVSAALKLVAGEMPDPIGSEFGLTFDEMTYGLDLREALEKLAQRAPYPELHYLVVAIRVQYGTGGNLVEVLSSLSRVLRERAGIQGKIRAWSAEGRMSAVILSALPLVIGMLINLLNPAYYRAVADDPMFTLLMGSAAAQIVGGMVVLRRMVNFRF